MKCASFFAGVGGIDLGFEENGFEIVYANEFDLNAATTYESNFNIKVDNRDIRNVKSSDLPDFDVLLAGFPCQPFSIAGYRQGFNDEKDRGNLFFDLLRIIHERKPLVIFLENVKNLISHDKGNTFRVISESLESEGYHLKFKVMNSKEYGNIAHGRERIYIVGFLNKMHYYRFDFPKPIELTKTLKDFIDFDEKVDDKYIYTLEKCKFYSKLDEEMKNTNSVYQWRRVYVRENKSNVCPTLTANMGTGGHNVPLIVSINRDNEKIIRKLTPRECFNLQGFPRSYNLPNVSISHLYKQAGNSVVVSVISRIANNISIAINEKNMINKITQLEINL